MTSQLIFWPVILLALVTLALYVPMSNARIRAIKQDGVKTDRFKLNEDEPASSAKFVNAITNQYESPVLFYAVVTMAHITANVTWFFLALAWLYTLAKIAHVYVHITSNSLRLRRPTFMVAYAALILLWLTFAFHIIMGS